MAKIIVATTLHDPNGDMSDMISKYGERVKSIVDSLHIVVSETTSPKIVDLLKPRVHVIKICHSKHNRDTYVDTLKSAFEEASETDRILYADYDRLLHWYSSYPEELSDVLTGYPDVDFYHIARTKRAFDTHPETQKRTEILANELGSKLLKFPETHDMLSACYGFSKRLLKEIFSVECRTELGFYALWSYWAYCKAEKWEYREVEGQEWETPDRFQKEIKEQGFEKWSLQFQTSKEWQRRVDLLADCLRELMFYIE